jgi:NAD-dependent dihydropyrimidine dehydrogenase PreA subunit
MERFVARLPTTKKPKPAFLLATAGGEPGAHFSLLAEQLAHKGYVALGARWLMFPESWPPHLTYVKDLANGAPYAEKLCSRYPALRFWLAVLWPEIGVPDEAARDGLERFIEAILLQAAEFKPGKAVPFRNLHKPMPGTNLAGRMMTVEMAEQYTAVKIVPERCSKCGVCIKVCPAGCIGREKDDDFPTFGPGCTGCWACFQHCPEQAVSGWKADPEKGRYPGPSKVLKERFKTLP